MDVRSVVGRTDRPDGQSVSDFVLDPETACLQMFHSPDPKKLARPVAAGRSVVTVIVVGFDMSWESFVSKSREQNRSIYQTTRSPPLN